MDSTKLTKTECPRARRSIHARVFGLTPKDSDGPTATHNYMAGDYWTFRPFFGWEGLRNTCSPQHYSSRGPEAAAMFWRVLWSSSVVTRRLSQNWHTESAWKQTLGAVGARIRTLSLLIVCIVHNTHLLVVMLVDNPLAFNFPAQPAFEDFFNMDLLSGSSSGAASSSRSSSSSPSQTFSPLPPTPPNAFPVHEPSTNPYFNFLDDEFNTAKIDPLAPPPAIAGPFDFLGAFSTTAALQSSSPDGGSGASISPLSSLGIDPQLVGTPATSKDMSEFGEEEEHHHDHLSPLDEDAEDEMDEESFDSPSPTDDSILEPHKVGGRGKNARKGTVQSGGIVKKSSATASKEKKEQQAGILTTTSTEPDDWRPTPEEYKKMSSKEKRQLRNKISARNFRVRRKEYITTLEGDIADRDRLIDHIRTELLGTKSENSALRQEIQALKKALLEGRGLPTTPVLPPPAPLSTVSPAATASTSAATKPATPKSPLLTPNIHKDLPTSPRLGARNFWGGAAAANLGGFGGITPVHTTLMPEWSSVLSGKPVATNAERRNPILQENINPSLNAPAGSQKSQQPGSQLPTNPFDSFADKNLFTLKSMEDYRMQLWTRMGQQQAQHRQMQQQTAGQPSTSQPALNGLASNMRPHFFTSKQSPTLSALLSGKSSSAYPSPPPSPPMAHQSPAALGSSSVHNMPSHAEQQAILAASLASQTLVRKLGSAFWDAFSGGSSSVGLPGPKAFDADKVRKVLEGKAVVRVVDVDPTPEKTSTNSVVERMAAMSLGGPAAAGPSSPTPSSSSVSDKKCGKPACVSRLEEGLRNMRM
ncbi:hypothetical protein BXZ70DRAFT_906499 [Cristinia sonorae]|uniref:BZIP domain-containing protein n=1 Tax=Cristinia sonorae TaxID=1940300 RepID=A0A8K0XR97_9AGAR|nr:hypothetical protein BXZ70DRAFT_906499 [Cristinia sonorae]